MKPTSALKYGRNGLIAAFSLLTCVAVAQAPTTSLCQDMISQAIARTAGACSDVTRNTVCYGNRLNSVVPAAGVSSLTFEQVGDRTNLADIAALHLSPLNETENLWGVALMQVQATLPDTLPGQNVTFLLFGGVTLDTVYPLSDGVSAEAERVTTPPQAFHFSTGIGQSRCSEAPVDGMIVQTPQGVGMVDFTLNGIEISLGSTAVISQDEDGSLSVALMEGHGIVKANGVSQILVPGAETRALAQSDDSSLRVPAPPAPIDSQRYAAIERTFPALPRAVELPAPAGDRALRKATRQSARLPKTDDELLNGCQRPEGWTTYRVRKGDTMNRIAGAAGLSVGELAAVNCIANPRLILRGQIVFVPVPVGRHGTPSPSLNPDDRDRRDSDKDKDKDKKKDKKKDKCRGPKKDKAHGDHGRGSGPRQDCHN